MKVIVKVSGFEEEKEKFSFFEEKRDLLRVRKLFFNRFVEEGRNEMLMRLMMRFKGLRFEDLEEVYNDGCLVLWDKMMGVDFELREECLMGYLWKICWNIGMHYLRKVNEDLLSLDRLMENGFGGVKEGENGLEEMFEVLSKKEDDEVKYKKLEKVWKKLKDVDRMILESYYMEGCKMEEIAKRVGYKNSDSVKSRKCRLLRKMMKMMNEEADFKNLPLAA